MSHELPDPVAGETPDAEYLPGSRGPRRAMKTVLLVSPSETLRSQFIRGLGDRSVFFASSDDEALKTLRATRVEAIVKEAAAPLREVPRFIARVRHLCPSAVVICLLPPGESAEDDETAAEAADFVLLQPFSSRHLQDVL